MVKYRNIHTSQVVVHDEPRSRFENSPNWERVEYAPDADTTAAAAQMRALADAERASIEEAAGARADHAALYHDAAAQIAAASATALPGAGPANVTASHTPPPVVPGAPQGVLARAKADQQSGALQVGNGAHPRTKDELEAKAAADTLAAQQSGVLARAAGDAALTSMTDLTAGPSRPAPSASKADWVTYVNAVDPTLGKAREADPELAADATAEDLTKAKLVEVYGSDRQ